MQHLLFCIAFTAVKQMATEMWNMLKAKTEEFVEKEEKQHTNLWQLKDGVTVEASEPPALLYTQRQRGRDSERRSERGGGKEEERERETRERGTEFHFLTQVAQNTKRFQKISSSDSTRVQHFLTARTTIPLYCLSSIYIHVVSFIKNMYNKTSCH